MAEPVVVDASTTPSDSVAGTPVVVDMPATRPDDDFYLMEFTRDDDNFTISLASWTQIDQSLVGTDTMALFWRIGDTEPSTYDVTISGDTAAEKAQNVVVRISGINTADPIGAVGTKNTGSSQTATAPAITAEAADSLILRIYACSSTYFDTFSAGTEVARITSETGGWPAYLITRESSPGASTTTGTETAHLFSSGQSWYAITIEILAAAGGATEEHFLTLLGAGT